MQRFLFRVFLVVQVSPLFIMAVAFVFLLVNLGRDAWAGRAFEKVQMNASTAQVQALLGDPDVVRACGENLWWGGDASFRGKNDGRCVTEARYEYPLSAWGIGYSREGRVVSKYHYVSE